MDISDKWFTLDNRRGPIWGSRGREFKSRQPDRTKNAALVVHCGPFRVKIDFVGDSAALPLVGRSIELDRVRAAIERAAAGAGSTVLLAGEEGIGKTRLAAEALLLARQRGLLTLSGTAYALHTDLAYAPVLDAIGPFLDSLPAGRLGQLVRGLPDLGRLFSNLAIPAPQPLGESALERTRLFDAVARLAERMAAERPFAILIDDMHWADNASLDLLHYIARGLGDQQVLLLGTYRLHEARTHPRLRSLVRSLQRLGLAQEMTLVRLPAHAVEKLAAAVLEDEPPEALLSLLQDRAAGTPLYVTAFIRGLQESGELFRSGGAWAVASGSLSACMGVPRTIMTEAMVPSGGSRSPRPLLSH
jgi:predicted ATPase